MKPVQQLRAFFDFALDDRSVRVGRLLFAVVLVVDLIRRWQFSEFFFSDTGVLTHEAWMNVWGKKPYYWSIHWGPDWYMDLLFGTQISLAIAMGLGVFPRISAFLGWFLLGSLVLRNPLMVYGGDKLSTLLLLAFAFVPTGAEKTRSKRLAQLGGFLFISQLVITYCAAGAAKIGPHSWQRGDALLHAVHMNLLVKPLGVWLSEFQSLLVLPSIATPWFELLWPWLLLLPAGLLNGWVRIGAIVALLGLNFGIFVTLDVGFFMLYTSPALLVLLPSHFWELGRFKSFGIKILDVVRSKECRVLPYSVVKAGSFSGIAFLSLVYWVTAFEGMKVYDIDWPWSAWNVIRTPNLYQNWGLFTNPNRKLQWYVAKAELESGEVVDILQNGTPVNYARPRHPNPVFWDNYRWRLAFAKSNKHFKEPSMRNRLAWAVGKHWDNQQPDERHVKSVKLYRMTKNLNFDKDEKRFWKIFGEYPVPPAKDEAVEEKSEAGAKAPTLKSPKLRKLQEGSLPKVNPLESSTQTGGKAGANSMSSQDTDAAQGD